MAAMPPCQVARREGNHVLDVFDDVIGRDGDRKRNDSDDHQAPARVSDHPVLVGHLAGEHDVDVSQQNRHGGDGI
jgi:hypothetical protein